MLNRHKVRELFLTNKQSESMSKTYKLKTKQMRISEQIRD